MFGPSYSGKTLPRESDGFFNPTAAAVGAGVGGLLMFGVTRRVDLSALSKFAMMAVGASNGALIVGNSFPRQTQTPSLSAYMGRQTTTDFTDGPVHP